MAVNVEMWQPLVKEALFKSNEFLSTMKNADEYVVGGSVVHIPQSGGPSDAKKNRLVLPANVHKRNDTDIVYPLDEYTTDPRLITNIDQVELSYNKMESIIREDTEGMMELVGDNILYDVAKNVPTASKIATTGTAAAATAPGATGNRKIITEAELRAAKKLLNKMNVPKDDRYLIIDSDMFDQLMSDNNLRYAFQQTVNLREGELPRLFGFQIIERSSVLVADNSQVLKAPGAASATSDAAVALFYQRSFVERALGDVMIFEKMKDPTYYGDVISFLVRAGSRASRADNKGYGVIYQAAE
jgi:hypothetical protein